MKGLRNGFQRKNQTVLAVRHSIERMGRKSKKKITPTDVQGSLEVFPSLEEMVLKLFYTEQLAQVGSVRRTTIKLRWKLLVLCFLSALPCGVFDSNGYLERKRTFIDHCLVMAKGLAMQGYPVWTGHSGEFC